MYIQLVHLPADHTARSVCAGVSAVMTPLPIAMRRSLTWDQGSELSEHAIIAKVLTDGVYFAHPAGPWQRGSNENINGLLRQYFSKSTDLAIRNPLDLRAVEELLNNRPRKRHGWKTSADIYAQLVKDSKPTVATVG